MELIVSSISVKYNWWRLFGTHGKWVSIYYLNPNTTSDHIKDMFNTLEKDDEVIIIYSKIKSKMGYNYKMIKNVIIRRAVVMKEIVVPNFRRRKGYVLVE